MRRRRPRASARGAAAAPRACGRAARRRPRRRPRAGPRGACRAPPRPARRARARPPGRHGSASSSPSATKRSATTSATIPTSRSAAAVPGPIAATVDAGECARVAAAALQQQPRGVRRGDADEAVGARVDRRAVDRLDADDGALVDLGAQVAQPRDEAAGLGAGARDDDATSVQRPPLGPGDLARAARPRRRSRSPRASGSPPPRRRRRSSRACRRRCAGLRSCPTASRTRASSGALPAATSAAATARAARRP